MPKILNQHVVDARPRLNANIASDDELFAVTIQRKHVAVQRRSTGGILRLAYGEMKSLVDTLVSTQQLLEDNQYDTAASLGDGYEAPDALNVPENPRGPNSRSATPAAEQAAAPAPAPVEAPAVESAATLGTGATTAQAPAGQAVASDNPFAAPAAPAQA